MAADQRIEDLRRRVERDPTSIAFAQLAEELRRAGDASGAVDVCRAGLQRHPDYTSARVTLGRALVALDQLDAAEAELEHVVADAPQNLPAIRALADIRRRRGDAGGALAYYRRALSLAHNDPELQEIVARLSREVGPESLTSGSPFDAGGLRSPGREKAPGIAPPAGPPPSDRERERAVRTIAALEQFLATVRANRGGLRF
jgi:predicted Zn-dependent protease